MGGPVDEDGRAEADAPERGRDRSARAEKRLAVALEVRGVRAPSAQTDGAEHQTHADGKERALVQGVDGGIANQRRWCRDPCAPGGGSGARPPHPEVVVHQAGVDDRGPVDGALTALDSGRFGMAPVRRDGTGGRGSSRTNRGLAGLSVRRTDAATALGQKEGQAGRAPFRAPAPPAPWTSAASYDR